MRLREHALARYSTLCCVLSLLFAAAGCGAMMDGSSGPRTSLDDDVAAAKRSSAQRRATGADTAGAPTSKSKLGDGSGYAAQAPAPSDDGGAAPRIATLRTSGGRVGIRRTDLDALLKLGANAFIGWIRVRPAFRRGRFLGWRVLSYRGPGALRRGDIVLRVNGQSVERPGQFIGVWQRLASAKVLVVEILRRGRRVRWAFPIVDA